MLDADEARERGLGAPRGCMIYAAIVLGIAAIIAIGWAVTYN